MPKIKISDNPAKVTNPGYKKVFRLYDKDGMAVADLIALEDETIDNTKPLRIFDPIQTYKRMTLTNFTARELLLPIFIAGKQVYTCPDIHDIADYAKREMTSMWDEYKRLLMPHTYKVDLSDRLYDLKQKLLRDAVGDHA